MDLTASVFSESILIQSCIILTPEYLISRLKDLHFSNLIVKLGLRKKVKISLSNLKYSSKVVAMTIISSK